MNPRSQGHPYQSNAQTIRAEIQRFESVHPSIYAVYDFIETIPDLMIQQQLRDHIICIEDSFVNSQEWTLCRSVVDLKLGVVGTVNSGRSALVHRYLTGSYLQEESPEGGRFKKEVAVDSQSYLLLIRDEGGPPELQFTQWVDAVIFVFSLENEMSFAAIYSYFAKMAHYHGNLQDIPIILVGTQDAISESNPRLIDDTRARKLASDLRRCAYYETCATYGLNVERVFQDACLKIIQSRQAALLASIRTNTPNHMTSSSSSRPYHSPQPPVPPSSASRSYDGHSSPSSVGGPSFSPVAGLDHHHHRGISPPFQVSPTVREKEFRPERRSRENREQRDSREPQRDREFDRFQAAQFDDGKPRNRNAVLMPTPPEPPPRLPLRSTSEPQTNTQQDLQKADESLMMANRNEKLGSGRLIPLKQGVVYKKSSKPLSREWKKKYMALSDDGRLTYYANINDYMGDIKGKEINLTHTTVKIPGQRPKGPDVPKTNPQFKGRTSGFSISGFKITRDVVTADSKGMDISDNVPPDANSPSSSSSASSNPASASKTELPNVKKRPKRLTDGDGSDFMIVSLDNLTWQFEALNPEDKDDWVTSIQQQIMTCLQKIISDKSKSNSVTVTDRAVVQTIRSVAGNSRCADCDMSNPDWASLNLGILVCIECCGIHRNLGTHLSRIRSIDLDEWPPDLIVTMTSMGNELANNIWEANTKNLSKPTSSATREERERWIRSKYELKEFLPPTPYQGVPITQQLIDAVARQSLPNTILVLAYSNADHVNAPYNETDTRTALHIAAALGNLVFVQMLLWYGADAKLIDHEGRNALFYAHGAGAIEVVELLKAHGCLENPTLPRRRTTNLPHSSSAGISNEAFSKLPYGNP